MPAAARSPHPLSMRTAHPSAGAATGGELAVVGWTPSWTATSITPRRAARTAAATRPRRPEAGLYAGFLAVTGLFLFLVLIALGSGL
jgi:hypothetical protein